MHFERFQSTSGSCKTQLSCFLPSAKASLYFCPPGPPSLLVISLQFTWFSFCCGNRYALSKRTCNLWLCIVKFSFVTGYIYFLWLDLSKIQENHQGLWGCSPWGVSCPSLDWTNVMSGGFIIGLRHPASRAQQPWVPLQKVDCAYCGRPKDSKGSG